MAEQVSRGVHMEGADLPPRPGRGKRRHRKHREETAGKRGGGIHTPRVFAYEWQTKGLRDRECVRVASKGLTDELFCIFAHDGRDL